MQPISFVYFHIIFLDDVSGIMFPSSGISLYTYVMPHNCNAIKTIKKLKTHKNIPNL
jgi:hypothetical protein